MYQEDMMDEGDGNGGCPPAPRVSVHQNSNPFHGMMAGNVGGEQRQVVEEETTGISSATPPSYGPYNHDPYNHSNLTSDPNLQRQYHEYPLPAGGQTTTPATSTAAATAAAYNANQPQHDGRGPPPSSRSDSQSPSKRASSSSSRNHSRSPSSGRRSSRSVSPGRRNNKSPRHSNAEANNINNGHYYMMPPLGTQSQSAKSTERNSNSNNKKKSPADEANERYEAQVALGIQLVLVFFCLLIVVAVAMAIFSHRGYWVIIAVSLSIIISLLVGLCCFLYKVVHEDDAPRINQRHMPKWYKTVTKIIRDEFKNFQQDWVDMCNNVYLLEDGDAAAGTVAATSTGSTGYSRNPTGAGGQTMQGTTVDDRGNVVCPPPHKSKKKKGKSALFKLVAKPAAVLASFRRKRKGKKKPKTSQQPLMPESGPTFPSTV